MRQVDSAAQTTAGRIKSAFGGMAGVLAGGAALAGLKSMMNDFDRVGKLATRFDTSAESIQRVSVAANIAGTDVEAVANAMTKAGIAASKAVENGGQMAEVFDRAGINAREFANANIDEKLLMIAEAYRAAGNDAQKTNAIIEIMGSRAGANLIPLISNVEALRAEMANVSVTSDATVRRIEEANDRMTRMVNNMKVYAADALGMFTDIFEKWGSFFGGSGFKTIKELEEEAVKIGGEFAKTTSTTKKITDELESQTVELEKQSDLMDEQAVKRRKAFEQELALTVAKAEGNDALVRDINERRAFEHAVEQGATTEEAANFAASKMALEDGRGATSPARTALEQLQDMGTVAGSAAASRIAGRGGYALAEADKLEARGMYRSAEQIRDRVARQADRRAEQALEKLNKDASKPEAQKKREAEEIAKAAEGAKGGGKATIDTIAEQILTEIKSRLPVVALGT